MCSVALEAWDAGSVCAAPRNTDSRQDLIGAAGRVLRQRGLHGLRVREVAAAAGMSPGSVMYHYPTTDDLLLAVHEDAQQRYLELRAQSAHGSGAAWSRLVAAFKVGLPPYSDNALIELLFEMHGLTRRSPRHAVLLSQLWEEELALNVDIVHSGISAGEFQVADPSSAARALLALEDGIALQLVSHNEALSSSTALTTFTVAAATILGNPELSRLRQVRSGR